MIICPDCGQRNWNKNDQDEWRCSQCNKKLQKDFKDPGLYNNTGKLTPKRVVPYEGYED